MSAPAVDAGPLAEEIWTILAAIPGVNAFDGQALIPAYDPNDPTTAAYWDRDTAGGVVDVHAYAIFYPGAGGARAVTLDETPDVLDWSFRVTCVGGDRTRALWCVDKVRAALSGRWLTVTIDEIVHDLVLAEAGDPGPVRRDDDETPPRFYVPLAFETTAV